MDLCYNDKNILKDAWNAIDKNELSNISIHGWQKKILKRSIPIYLKCFAEKLPREQKRRKADLLKFAPYGLLTPVFWGIVNHAVLKGMEMSYFEANDSLVVQFRALNGRSVQR